MTDQILFPPLSRRLFFQGLSTILLRRPGINILALDKDVSMTESVNLTMITPGYITDSTGVVWSLVQSSTKGAQVCRGGTILTYTANVVLLLYFNHAVYQKNTSDHWYVYQNGSFIATIDPLVPAGTVTNVVLSATSYPANAPAATTIGTISVVMSDGSTFAGTLTVRDTADFQIVSNALEANATLSQSSYSVTITATPAGGTAFTSGAFNLTASSTLRATIQPPTQAAKVGYTNLVFADDFNTMDTIATTQNANFGGNLKWFWNFAIPNAVPYSSIVRQPTMKAASIQNGNTSGGPNASPNGGIVQLTTGIWQPGGNNGNIITVPGYVYNDGRTPLAPLGQGHWRFGYFEAYIQCSPNNPNGTNQDAGWPAFWAWNPQSLGSEYGFSSARQLSAANFTEIDFFETWGHVYSGTPGSWQINIYGDARAFHTTGFLPASSRHAWNAEWHTLGMLWQPGLMTFFMDNQQVWQQAYTSAQSSIDSQSLFLILGTGRNWLVNVDWVRVWQAP
jgi:hypothetical protein